MKRKVYQVLASLIQARLNCIENNNTEWRENHENTILQVVNDHLPHGSGFDNGTKIDIESCTPNKLVFYFSFHHMDSYGMYDGWSDHTVTVTPSSLAFGVDIAISDDIEYTKAKQADYEDAIADMTEDEIKLWEYCPYDSESFLEYAYESFSYMLNEYI